MGSAAIAGGGIETPGAGAAGDLAVVDEDVVGADAAGIGARAPGRSAATSCLNSFVGTTPVTLADGGKEPISKVRVGDKVLATDPETGETRSEPVVRLIQHSGEHTMVLIRLVDGSVLDSTDGHPIWDATRHAFVDASELHVGDQVETDTGALITITRLTTYDAQLTAYNLQIDQIHTYYAGTTPVLVHNSCGPNARVSEVLKGKLGSINRAPLPRGTPPLSAIGDMTMAEVEAAAQAGTPGFKTLWKLLNDNRFNK